jgi:two-component system, cell cycle response regulator
MRILIAEDDITSLTVLAGVLKKSGHEVVETVNGAEAWGALQKPDAPLLVILDWMMPEMEGLEVVRRVRAMQSHQSPYIIMLTTKSEKGDIIAGLEAGANDYLSKPFDSGELRARVAVGCRIIEMQGELLRTRNALAYEATHDPLTGILNRRAIEATFSRELSRARRNNECLAVAICDIDYFKKINDTYGHAVGDEVLCGFVRILESGMRDYDYLGRFGGEEFLLLSSGVKAEDAVNLFERLRVAVADTLIPTSAGNLSVTISIGIRIAREKETMGGVLLAADSAMYQAKSEGRNRVCVNSS